MKYNNLEKIRISKIKQYIHKFPIHFTGISVRSMELY